MSTASPGDPRSADVLTVGGLTVRAHGHALVEDVDFGIRTGERVGLIGESGSGKSLTALALMGLLPEGLQASGSVAVAGVGHDLVGAGEYAMSRVRGKDIGMVFQEPMTALNPTMRVGRQVAEAMLIHRTRPDRRSAHGAAVELLDQVGLPDPGQSALAYPHQLSGGQRQRVVLALALANDPKLLICDEPTTALDVTVQAMVLDLIVKGVAQRDSAMLFITHDLSVVAAACERVLVMYGGRVVEAGPVEEVFTRPRHRYTQGLVGASDLTVVDGRGRLATIAGSVPAAGEFPAGCVFRNRCPYATERCGERPAWTETSGDAGYACHHPAPTASPSSVAPLTSVAAPGTIPTVTHTDPAGTESARIEPVGGHPADADADADAGAGAAPALSVRDLVRDYRRPRSSLLHPSPAVHALRGVSFDVAPGERFGIVGESGCGKSTLLRIISGLDQATSGTVTVAGRTITHLKERQLRFLRQTLQLVFQDPMSSLDPRMRVRDIVAEPLVAQGHSRFRERVAELLRAVGLHPDAAERYPHQFSGGQRQRISIARALAPRPQILVADEPVSALDVSVRAQVLNLIADLVEELSLTLVFVSHDLSVVRHVCDRVAVMHQGQIVEIGPIAEVYENPQHPYTQTLIAAIPTLDRALSGDTVADLAPALGEPG